MECVIPDIALKKEKVTLFQKQQFPLQKQVYPFEHKKTYFDRIFILLSVYGIDVSSPGNPKKYTKVLAGVFHVVWIAVVCNAAVCFDPTDITYHSFTMIKYICSMLSWWMLYLRRHKLKTLPSDIERLKMLLRMERKPAMEKWGKFLVYFFGFIIFGPGVICCLKLWIVNQDPRFFCQYMQKITAKYGAKVLHFFMLTAFNYSSLGLPYIIMVFYCMYCVELIHVSKRLENCHSYRLKECNESQEDESYYKGSYLFLIKLVRKLESNFSSLIFFIFVNSFLEILRIESIVLMFMRGRWKLDVFVHSLYYSTIAFFSFVATITSADQVQIKVRLARKILKSFPKYASVQRCLQELKEEIACWQEMRHTSLTAWGMFKVKRDLFISITALYISYGVLIAQITG